jgi:GTPase SAR1 family protein
VSERANQIAFIFKNLTKFLLSVFDIRREHEAFEVSCPPELNSACEDVSQMDRQLAHSDTVQTWAHSLVLLCKHSWVNSLLKETSLQFPDSIPYFVHEIDRICAPNFIPTNQDILRSRTKTTGIIEKNFFVQQNGANFRISMFDVGGQRGQRSKWVKCFEKVNALFFVTSLSEYDMVLEEESTVNRMEESLTLFETMLVLDFFRDTPFILFLNKTDLFREKLSRGIQLSKYFPEYKGANEYDPAYEFVSGMYEQKAKSRDGDGSKVHIHPSNATDTDNIKKIWNSCKSIILAKIMDAF